LPVLEVSAKPPDIDELTPHAILALELEQRLHHLRYPPECGRGADVLGERAQQLRHPGGNPAVAAPQKNGTS